MKLHTILFVLIGYLVVQFLIVGCARSEKDFRDGKSQAFMMLIGDSVSKNPAWVCKLADSLLASETDSFDYYQLLMLKAKALMFLSVSDSTMCYLDKIETYCEKANRTPEVIQLCAEAWNVRGNVYSRIKASADSAVWAYRKAYGYAMQIKDKTFVPDICLNLGDAYVRLARYDEGSYWYRYALSVFDSLRIPEEKRFPVYYGLAQVNMELRYFSKCDYYYDLAYRFYDRMQPFEKHIYLNNRGNSYYFREDYETALKYFRRSLELSNQYPGMEFERNLTMINLGEVYLLLNRTDSAEYYLSRCYDFFHSIGNISALYYIDTQLIELALKQGNLELASRRLKEAVKPEHIDPNMVHIRNRYLQHYYAEKGDFKQAYHYQSENQRIDDSTRNEWIKMRVMEIALQYSRDSTLMKKEISIREKENQVLRLHQWLYAAISGVLLLAILILVIRRKRDRERWRMQTVMTSLRLANVRSRISPHFIFNVLSREVNLHSKAEKDDGNLMGLIKLLRRNLEMTDSVSVSLADELDFVSTYIQLEKEVLGEQFTYVQDIDKDIDLATVHVPSMLIQIPVENAIKHGLRTKQGKRLLNVQIRCGGEAVEIIIRDNGGGYREKSLNRGTGTGMKVITRTIQLLNYYNRTPITMCIGNVPMDDGETGCEVRFVVPLDYSYQLNKR